MTAFKLAVLEKAGFLVGIAKGHQASGAPWLEAFEAGRRDAAKMLAPTSAR